MLYPTPPDALQAKINVGNFRAIGQRFMAHFVNAGLLPNDRVLEIGCGCGRTAIPLAEGYLGPKGSYQGFDIIPAVIDWCVENITDPRFQFRCVDVQNGDYRPDGIADAAAFAFPYESESFDFVYAVSVFTHMLPDGHARYLRETLRVLRPGGRAFFSYFILPEPNPWTHRCGIAFISLSEVPERGVGYTPDMLLKEIGFSGLIVEAVHRGNWAGYPGHFDYQDAVVARRGWDENDGKGDSGMSTRLYCDVPWWSAFVEITGEVRPCCDYGLVLGHLGQQGAKAIWDERFATLRQLQQLGTAPAGCGQCCAARIGRVGTEG